MKTDFHDKNFALRLALKWRLRGTQKWPIKARFCTMLMAIICTFITLLPTSGKGVLQCKKDFSNKIIHN